MIVEYKIEDVILFQPAKFRLLYNEKEIQLSQKEAEVLQLLCKHAQHVVERKIFLHEIWDNREGGGISLNKCVLTLRRKFESLGYLDGINTIPRIGYMFRLNIAAIDVVTPELDGDTVKGINSPYSPLPQKRKTTVLRYECRPLYLFFILVGLLPFLFYKIDSFNMSEKANVISYKKAYGSPSLNIIEMANLHHKINYAEFISRLPSNKNMLVSISNTAISLIGDNNGSQSWSNVFILDPNTNINIQLTCIADYIGETSVLTDNDVPAAYASTITEQGPAFHKKRFYSSCLDTRPDYIGEIVIRSTHYPSNHPKSKQPSSLIQDILFYDNNAKPVFHFTSVFRVSHFYERENEFDFFVQLHFKSLKIEFIDQPKIDKNKYINLIFNEYDDDDIFLKSLVSRDGKSVSVLSSVFDGTLSQGVRLAK